MATLKVASHKLNFSPGADTYKGRRIRGFEGALAPPVHEIAPSHYQKHPFKTKGNLMKHRFKLTSNKFMVLLTFILGLYLSKTSAIYRFTLN